MGARQAVQVGKRVSVLRCAYSRVDRLARQSTWMEAADAKASDMAATQTHAAQMRYAAEAHPTAAAAQMHSAAAADVETTSTTVETTSATADVSATTAAAATEAGLRGRWRHNGRQRRQQDCANHNSIIFHEYLPEQSRAPRLDAAATTEAACPSRGLSCSSLRYQNRGELCENDGDLPARRCDK